MSGTPEWNVLTATESVLWYDESGMNVVTTFTIVERAKIDNFYHISGK